MAESIKRQEERLKEALQHSDYKLLIDLLFLCVDQEQTEIITVLEQNEWILPRVCELGFIDILQRIFDLKVTNINASYLGKTGLQYASQNGHTDIVTWLLDHGANLKQNVWEEDSEFYLATLNGKQDVLTVLLKRKAEMISDKDVCYCLFYAACQGGHLELVKKWFSPSTDVVNKIVFTPGLIVCEQRYPLFVACRERNLEVAKFLIEEGDASITKDICHHFREFTTKLVRSMFLTCDMKGGQYFNMSNHKIETLLPCWFSEEKRDYLKTDDDNISCEDEDDVNEEKESLCEIVIDVQETNLQELPESVLWMLKELISLNASHNPLGTIPDSLLPDSLHLNGLKSLNFAHCHLRFVSPHVFSLPCLEKLNLSYNKLSSLCATENTACNKTWKCLKLQSLDLSYNMFESLPLDIQVCTEMISLNASHNQLNAACSPWQCPLKSLDLSNNKLTTFPPSADQYWEKTLMKLCLHHNQFTEVTESIVKMRTLSYLNISYNEIQRIPPSSLWKCPLAFLNLSHNKLGTGRCNASLEFPVSCFASNLMELSIASNDLDNVPMSICEIKKLSALDLSNNIRIRNLPPELGKLKNLYKLKVDGIIVHDTQLQKLLSSLNNDTKAGLAINVTDYLERMRRNCDYPGILKVVVLGCKNKDGHCIVQELTRNHNARPFRHECMTVTELNSKQRKVKFEIWELPDTKVTTGILPCFLTLNSLYLIIHDATNSRTDLHLISEKVASIQAYVCYPQILIVCTYSNWVTRDEQDKIEGEITSTFPRTKFVSVTFGARECSSTLLQHIHAVYETMADVSSEKVKLCERLVPSKFLEVVRNVKRLNLNKCRLEELLHAAGCSQRDLEDGIDERLNLHEFLLQAGVMLHYDNHMGDLSDLVILNPAWLFKILSQFLKSLTERKDIIAQLPLTLVREKFQRLLEDDSAYFPAILKLMESFNIGVRLIDSTSQGEEVLLIPSLLPNQASQIQLAAHKDSCKTARLYYLPVIPLALWSHLISLLILAFGRFSTSKWKLGERTSETLDKGKSFMMSRETSMEGLQINNRKIQYWKTGIMLDYDQGHVMVKEVECISSAGASESGILVTVQTTGNVNVDGQTEQYHNNKKNISVMGIVGDEIEEVLDLLIPKYRDECSMNKAEIYALCPLCYNIKPVTHSVNLQNIHFTVRDCAQILLSKDVVVCQSGPSSLDCLVPELFFMELPSKMRLSADDIIVTDVKLGEGMAGVVAKAIYKGTDVAVKLFYDSTVRPCAPRENNVKYPNIAEAAWDKKKQDHELETEQTKITTAFSDVRREVGIMSKLKHEFIVTFIGVCIRPRLLLVMELAPYGSLRGQLMRMTQGISSDIEQMEREITRMIFSKDLTYKIILQIGCGLCYLHENNIIYRDLKPDNILVMSLSVDDRVNVKLSDYGISKFTTLQGIKGLVGTRGYMAPEVKSKQFYKEKADIYSYAMVMLETLTGLAPLEYLQRPNLSDVENTEITPPHIQGWKIQCNFPYFEILMKECWSYRMDERPSSENVVKRMKSDQFLLLHDSIILDGSSTEHLEITCVYACQTGGRWKIWISESGQGNNRFISVYDIESSGFSVHRKACPGPRINDMAKVGPRIWVVCKELGSLEVIDRGNKSNFEICSGAALEASATKILNHYYGNSEAEGKSIILVGLENGCLTVFHFSTSYKKYVTVITNIELQINFPVTEMCSLDHSLIAVACGMTVYFQQIGLSDSQEHDKSKMTKCTWTPKLISSGSTSLEGVTQMYNPVVAMTGDSNVVWCCLENSPILVKVDARLMKITLVLNISWNSVHDTVRLDEMGNTSGLYVRLVASESAMTSRHFGHENDTLKNHRFSVDDDVFSKAETNDAIASQHPTLSAYGSTNSEQRSPGSESDIESPLKACYEISSDLRSVPEKTPLSRSRSQTTSANDKPPLPPRRINVLSKAFSMPGLVSKQPLVPNRIGCEEIIVSITSLKLSTDVLIIGTSSGGIVLLPLTYNNNSDTSNCLSALPFQLPMLRHPAKKGNINTGQGMTITGSISTLTLANDRLVSLHIFQNQAPLRRQSKRGRNVKRKGAFYPADSLNVLNSSCQFEEEVIREQSSLNDTDCMHSTAEKLEAPSAVVDIAVWDRISRSRLQTIRSYGHNSIKCSGWCCRATDSIPASASSSDV